MAYGDSETGQMLIADPGGIYRIRAVEPNLPVPPGDGRWAAVAAPPPEPSPPPILIRTGAPVSDEDKGGEI
jgi:hypothetical protein